MNRRTINLIIVFITLIIFVGISYFIIIPGFSEVWDKIATLNNKKNTYVQEKNNIEKIKSNESRHQELAKVLDKLYQTIPTQKEIDSFAVNLDEKAKTSGNEIKTIKIVTPTEAKTLKKTEEDSGAKMNNQIVTQTTNKEKSLFTQMLKVGNLYAVQFELTFTGNLPSLSNFLSLAENMNRFVDIKNVDSKQTSDNSLETTVSGLIYVKPE